ncbi:hypothetical protein ACFS27_22705 [Promicromonospora vindobonensis]|uniref:Uncharacterized protein n=1 Tax=Promicromonospora vindobonensis TaxID=195748 RepID=A0ABW5VXJ8_9MICO
MTRTATEFADDKGHTDYPLLHPRYSPQSTVPCVDFSPWLREQLTLGDSEAVIAWYLQVVQADPPLVIPMELDLETGEVRTDDPYQDTSPEWTSAGIAAAREVLDLPLDGLIGIGQAAGLDLRISLLMHLPHGQRLGPSALLHAQPDRLAVMMAPHEVRLADALGTVHAVNNVIRELAREDQEIGIAPIVAPLSLEQIQPPERGPTPTCVAALPLATRSHLLDLSMRTRSNRPGTEEAYATYYDTRLLGCDEEQSLNAMLDAGIVSEVDDRDVIWQTKATSLTAAQLRELLGAAGITHPKGGTKARLANLALPIAERVLEVVGPTRVVEMTSEGRAAAEWIAKRADDTRWMWAAWAALRQPKGSQTDQD